MTKIINMDDLAEEPILTIVCDGVSHNAQPTTIEDFIANMKLVESLTPQSTFLDEIEVCIKVIGRAFPTIGEEKIRKWQVTAIQKVFAAVRGFDGQNASTGDEKSAEGNAPAS